MSYSQVKMDDAPPGLVERQTLAETWDTNDGRIKISVHVDQKKQMFSEGDIVTGSCTVESLVDVFDPYIEIDFVGFCTTHWENPLMGAGVFEGKHSFLTMSCPVEEMPMLKAQKPVTLTWEFTVPARLLPTSCKHEADEDTERAHLCLPPSMDPADSRHNPASVRVIYGTRVRANGVWDATDTTPALLAEKFEEVRFMSGAGGRNNFYPPVDVNSYCSIVSQTVENKSIGRSQSSGELTIETTGMPSMTLDIAMLRELPEVELKQRITSVGLRLAFKTSDARLKPPEPQSISAKLGIVTNFSTVPTNRPPTLKRNIRTQGFSLETIKFPQWDMDHSNWKMHEADGKFIHEAYLVYPIERGNVESLVPTFNSCLVSRHYKISLKIVMKSAGNEFTVRPETPMLVAHNPSVSEHH